MVETEQVIVLLKFPNCRVVLCSLIKPFARKRFINCSQGQTISKTHSYALVPTFFKHNLQNLCKFLNLTFDSSDGGNKRWFLVTIPIPSLCDPMRAHPNLTFSNRVGFASKICTRLETTHPLSEDLVRAAQYHTGQTRRTKGIQFFRKWPVKEDSPELSNASPYLYFFISSISSF